MKKTFFFLGIILFSFVIQAQDKPEPKPAAPYSPAVMTAGGMLFISGQIPIDPESGELMKGDISQETRIVMERIGVLLENNSMNYSDLVKCTIFLTDIHDYQKVNKVYASFFEDEFPAREAIEISNLPLGASIEISGIAAKK